MENTVRPFTYFLRPLTVKFRFALNLKGLRYRTEWVEWADIETVCKEIGAPPTSTKKDGSPRYTLPVIYDPSTKTIISNSPKIADYLDATYPDTQPLFPPGTRGLQAAFRAAFTSGITSQLNDPLWSLTVLPECLNLSDRNSKVFRVAKEAEAGKKLEQVAPEGEVREAVLQQLEKNLLRAGSWYKANGDTPFIMGDIPIQSDLGIASCLLWVRQTVGRDTKEWARIVAFDDGRWGRFMQAVEKYTQVV
ncbi:hypothetical protein EUX98_g3658 [Antrodiella citrinella]|uniref:GST N-terminal domain-containing protein n=1 Tax=Antrodiella citrinella TaxID=2447956 RepID=A0A4S4MVY3_9APHY|nr:hypothetical protein EUX98_g3658 [Antrodiella citrinella]